MTTQKAATLEKILPIEKILIKHMINGGVSDIVCELSPDDFVDKLNRELFEAICKNDAIGNETDVSTIGALVAESKLTLSRLMEIAGESPSTTNIEWALEIVKKFTRRRSLILRLRDLFNEAIKIDALDTYDLDAKIEALIEVDEVRSKIHSFQEGLLNDTIREIEQDLEKGGSISVKTGIDTLDSVLGGGLKNSRLYTIAARPGMGKTALATNIALSAMKQRFHPLFISIELNEKEITERLISAEGHIPTTALAKRQFSDDQLDRILDTSRKLREFKFSVNSTTGASWEKVENSIRSSVKYLGVNIVFIDYLQQFHLMKKMQPREEITYMTRRAKQIAMEHQIPVVLVAQLNRDVDRRLIKTPILSDLKESGSIEEDSDVVIMLYREKKENIETDDDFNGDFWLKVAKNRQGNTGHFAIKVDLSINKFF